MASTKPTSRAEEEVLGVDEPKPLGSTECEEDSDGQESMQSDDEEENLNASESSDIDDRLDRLQGLDTVCGTDSLLEHSGNQDSL